MEFTKTIDLITQNQKYLIDYSNMQDGLIFNQNEFQNLDQVNYILENPNLGIPMVLPLNIDNFEYPDNINTFELDKYKIAQKLFRTNNIDYVGIKSFFQFGNKFCVGAKPKKSSYKVIKSINNQNQLLIDKVKKLKYRNKSIGSFQTRNIPHLGHEKIIEMLLKHCDHVIINPVIGPKKNGDFKNAIIKSAYEFLSKNFYNNRISYTPICANMFYAGPREAIHHSLLRSRVGFTHFTVGRDHAGAENIYPDKDATILVKQYEKQLDIKVITHLGSFYSNKINDIILADETFQDDDRDIENISGTEFRKNIVERKIYRHARVELQKYLYTISDNYFINNY